MILVSHYSHHLLDCYTHPSHNTHNVSFSCCMLQVTFVVFENLLNLNLYVNHGLDCSYSTVHALTLSHINYFCLSTAIETRDWTQKLQVVICQDIWQYLNPLNCVSRQTIQTGFLGLIDLMSQLSTWYAFRSKLSFLLVMCSLLLTDQFPDCYVGPTQ